jgi:signal transduction histidine kinase
VKIEPRSRLHRDALLVFGLAALVLVLASLGFQLWVEGTGGTVGSLWGTLFTMLSGLLVLGAGAVYVRLSSRRVQHLLRGIEAARKGQYPLLVAQGDDEISELTVGFNQIIEELRARRESLTDLVDTKETELVQLTQAKPPAKEKLEDRLESVGEGVIVLDMDGNVIMANEQVSETFGVPATALTAAPLATLIAQVRHRLVNRSAVEQLLGDLEAGKQAIQEMVLELDAADGPAIRLYSAPVRGADSAMLGRIATLMDLGREREVDRLKTEFLSTISHELRTPLTSVKGALGLIRGGAAGSITSDMRELLEIASTNIDRLINVINNILDVLSLERGQAGFRFAPTSVVDCVSRAAAVVSGEGKQAGVNVVNDLPENLPGVRGDAKRLEQLMVNLLSNAIKFSRRGQTVFVGGAAENGELKVSVKDSGKGISREAIGRLFQKFEHSEGALTRGSQGAGLGLAICRHIVEAHGGRIWVESTEGSGSTFWFTVPVDAQTVDPASFRRSPAERAGGAA